MVKGNEKEVIFMVMIQTSPLWHPDKQEDEEIFHIATDPVFYENLRLETKRKVDTAYDKSRQPQPRYYTIFVKKAEMDERGYLPLSSFPEPRPPEKMPWKKD